MDLIDHLLGLHEDKLKDYQMCFRALVVFFTALIYIRLAGVRTFGRKTVFDQVTALILGSVLGRAIVSNESFTGSLLGCLVIMLLHRFISWITYKSHSAGRIFKGDPLRVYKNGEFIEKNMSKTLVTKNDMIEAIRLLPNLADFSKIKEVYVERSGEIGLVKKEE